MNMQAATSRSTDGQRRAAVFLDRDGVLVRAEVRDGKSYAVRRLENFRLLPGASEAVRALRDHGFLTVVVTNQPDIGNGLVAAEVVAAMHDILRKKLPLDSIELCPHRQADNCGCRKPKTGMLTAAAARFSIDFSASFLVGDRCSDIVAGRSVGCYTLFVDRGYDRCTDVKPHAVVRSLRQAVQHILSRTVPRGKDSSN
ncbi:MAG: D-glycero-alpha-D-manno-heptose-1,7-bisphosphate 7-phosphatase [Xanthobacteraceae bacterium]|jgi:D-glycero-D-manno-heptose 1,7-bisphosphate phosphatase